MKLHDYAPESCSVASADATQRRGRWVWHGLLLARPARAHAGAEGGP